MNFDIEAIKRKMLVKYPFFGSVVSNVDYKEMKEIRTAATDGKIIYYNPEFLDNLSIDEQIFIFSHEVCHIAFNHILRSENKNPKIWNIATDGVINAFLKNDGLKMAKGGVDIAEAINYNAEQLYEKLLNENQQQDHQNSQNQNEQENSNSSQGSNSQSDNNKSSDRSNQNNQQNESSSKEEKSQENKGGTGQNNNDSEENQDVGHDTHSMWADAVKKNKENKDNKNKDKKDNNKASGGNLSDEDNKNDELEKKQKETESLGERESFKKNLEEKKNQLEKLKRQLSKQAMGAGNQPGNSIRSVSDIGQAKPLIDWRYILRETTKYDVDWSYRNATIENGVVSANLEEKPIPETEIVLDTSGSINENLLRNFLRECKNILKHSRVKVGCFDTRFYGFHEIRNEKDIENMKFEGGGGTDFDAAVNAFSKRVDNKIIFTDGEARMPKKEINAIWIVFGYHNINPKGGKVIHITGEQLRKLNSFEIVEEYKGRNR